MNLIRHFLAGYTESFILALVLWPMASLALTLPILAWLYHRDGRLRFGSAVSTYLAVLYVLGLGCRAGSAASASPTASPGSSTPLRSWGTSPARA